MTVSVYNPTNYITQTVSDYSSKIDSNFSVLERLGNTFAPHAQAFPDMTIALDAGYIFSGLALTEVAAQSTAAITGPASNPRIDRIVVSTTTGAVSVVTGGEAAVPTPPAIPTGSLPIAQVLLSVSSTAIINNMITDERALVPTSTISSLPAVTQTGANYTYNSGNLGCLVRRSNSGSLMTDTLPVSSVMAAGWFVTIANDDPSALLTIIPGSGSLLNAAALGYLTLGPNQRVTISSDGTDYNVVVQPDRVRLGANTTLYVSTSGSDSNTGTSSSSAFQTIQKAINVVADYYDVAGFVLTIQLADGTYSSGFTVGKPWVGGSYDNVVVSGNTSTPSNVIISASPVKALAYASTPGAGFTLQGVKLQTASSGGGLAASNCSAVAFNNIVFGSTVEAHVSAFSGGRIFCTGNYAIIGGAPEHLAAQRNGEILLSSGTTVTLSGVPAFSIMFALANVCSYIDSHATYSGSATGQRYYVSSNAVIYVGGAGANYFPGSIAGSTASGGIYS